MPLTGTVEVGVPAQVAWERWADFEAAPLFVDRLTAVELIDELRARWTDAARRVWETSLVEAVPHERLCWASEELVWLVAISPAGPSRCVVCLTLTTTEGAEPAPDAALVPVPRDLERFRVLLEAWVDPGEGWTRAVRR